jgi:hypothetical protein
MRWKTGLIVGFAAGYYFGAKAGRERYEEIEDVLERVRATEMYGQARARVDSVVHDVTDNARLVLNERRAAGDFGADVDDLYDQDLHIPSTWFDDQQR